MKSAIDLYCIALHCIVLYCIVFECTSVKTDFVGPYKENELDSITHSVSQSVGRSVGRSVSQSVSQSVRQNFQIHLNAFQYENSSHRLRIDPYSEKL